MQLTLTNFKNHALKKPDKFGYVAAFVLAFLLITYQLSFWKIVKANSHSTSDGYFLILFSNSSTINNDDYVVVCIPNMIFADFAIKHKLPHDSNYCPFHTVPLIKSVIAKGSDYIVENSNGVTVNGKAITNSIPLKEDGLFFYKTNGEYLKNGEFFVMGTSPRSLDSRYYGPLTRTNIIGKAYLLWKI